MPLLLLSLSGCWDHPSGTLAPADPIVAMVGAEPITKALFDHYATSRAGVPSDQLDARLHAAVLEDLKQLAAAARTAATHPDLDTQQELALNRLEVLAHAAAQKAGIYDVPTNAEVRAAYDAYVNAFPPNEYHVAHILVATEETAHGVLAMLQAHADFGKLATTESADESKVRGGDLGWIVPGKLPATLTDAVAALKPGEVAQKPVQTSYGWHVIKLLESRATKAPPFERVSTQLSNNIVQDRYRAFLAKSLSVVGTH